MFCSAGVNTAQSPGTAHAAGIVAAAYTIEPMVSIAPNNNATPDFLISFFIDNIINNAHQ